MSDMRSQTPRSQSDRASTKEVVSITYEEIGLFPRSFSRVLDRFLKQVFSDVENLVLREYRFYRYLFLTTVKSLLILFLVPFFVNFLVKTYVIRPLTSYFWNTQQTEIFLNSYQQKHAFAELKDFEEKLYFESLIYPHSGKKIDSYTPFGRRYDEVTFLVPESGESSVNDQQNININNTPVTQVGTSQKLVLSLNSFNSMESEVTASNKNTERNKNSGFSDLLTPTLSNVTSSASKTQSSNFTQGVTDARGSYVDDTKQDVLNMSNVQRSASETLGRQKLSTFGTTSDPLDILDIKGVKQISPNQGTGERQFDEKTESLIHSYTLKSSLFVYQTREADKNIQQRYQEKTIELAQRYNDQSIEAITNFFGDVVSLASLFYLLYALEIQINITKSFLLEVFFGLDDSKKSLLILLVTDLLVGYHSSNLWELFFSLIFHHYGLPESQTGIFLLVATLPVLLDVLFKYLIFRHLNRSSPATVATYHAMIE